MCHSRMPAVSRHVLLNTNERSAAKPHAERLLLFVLTRFMMAIVTHEDVGGITKNCTSKRENIAISSSETSETSSKHIEQHH